MKKTEYDMLHDAIAQAVTRFRENPSTENEYILTGMRQLVSLLGMPEGQPDYHWGETGTIPVVREYRRRQLMQRLRAFGPR